MANVFDIFSKKSVRSIEVSENEQMSRFSPMTSVAGESLQSQGVNNDSPFQNKDGAKASGNYTYGVESRQDSQEQLSPFTIPKLKRSKQELFMEMATDSREWQQEILPTLTKYFRFPSSSAKFEFLRVSMVQNAERTQKYSEKRKELRHQGYSERDIADSFAFLYVEDDKQTERICREGLGIGNLTSSTIGHPRMGVQMCRYMDTVRSTNFVSGSTGKLIVFKIMKGRVKVVPENRTGPPLEPTPNFDSHMPKSSLDITPSSHQQLFELYQVYLYEYGEDLTVEPYPRHVLPFAVISFRYKEAPPSPRMPESPPVFSPRLMSPPIPKFTLSTPKEEVDPEYVIWCGHLRVKDIVDCQVKMVSTASQHKPAYLGTVLNVRDTCEMKTAEERYFKELSCLRKSGEVYWKGWYINVAELRPRPDSKAQFQSLMNHLGRTNSMAVLKPENDVILLLVPNCSLTHDLGLTRPHHYPVMFHCIFISKQSAKFKSPRYLQKVLLHQSSGGSTPSRLDSGQLSPITINVNTPSRPSMAPESPLTLLSPSPSFTTGAPTLDRSASFGSLPRDEVTVWTGVDGTKEKKRGKGCDSVDGDTGEREGSKKRVDKGAESRGVKEEKEEVNKSDGQVVPVGSLLPTSVPFSLAGPFSFALAGGLVSSSFPAFSASASATGLVPAPCFMSRYSSTGLSPSLDVGSSSSLYLPGFTSVATTPHHPSLLLSPHSSPFLTPLLSPGSLRSPETPLLLSPGRLGSPEASLNSLSVICTESDIVPTSLQRVTNASKTPLHIPKLVLPEYTKQSESPKIPKLVLPEETKQSESPQVPKLVLPEETKQSKSPQVPKLVLPEETKQCESPQVPKLVLPEETKQSESPQAPKLVLPEETKQSKSPQVQKLVLPERRKQSESPQVPKLVLPEETKQSESPQALKLVLPEETKQSESSQVPKLVLPEETKQSKSPQVQKFVLPERRKQSESLQIPKVVLLEQTKQSKPPLQIPNLVMSEQTKQSKPSLQIPRLVLPEQTKPSKPPLQIPRLVLPKEEPSASSSGPTGPYSPISPAARLQRPCPPELMADIHHSAGPYSPISPASVLQSTDPSSPGSAYLSTNPYSPVSPAGVLYTSGPYSPISPASVLQTAGPYSPISPASILQTSGPYSPISPAELTHSPLDPYSTVSSAGTPAYGCFSPVSPASIGKPASSVPGLGHGFSYTSHSLSSWLAFSSSQFLSAGGLSSSAPWTRGKLPTPSLECSAPQLSVLVKSGDGGNDEQLAPEQGTNVLSAGRSERSHSFSQSSPSSEGNIPPGQAHNLMRLHRSISTEWSNSESPGKSIPLGYDEGFLSAIPLSARIDPVRLKNAFEIQHQIQDALSPMDPLQCDLPGSEFPTPMSPSVFDKKPDNVEQDDTITSSTSHDPINLPSASSRQRSMSAEAAFSPVPSPEKPPSEPEGMEVDDLRLPRSPVAPPSYLSVPKESQSRSRSLYLPPPNIPEYKPTPLYEPSPKRPKMDEVGKQSSSVPSSDTGSVRSSSALGAGTSLYRTSIPKVGLTHVRFPRDLPLPVSPADSSTDKVKSPTVSGNIATANDMKNFLNANLERKPPVKSPSTMPRSCSAFPAHSSISEVLLPCVSDCYPLSHHCSKHFVTTTTNQSKDCTEFTPAVTVDCDNCKTSYTSSTHVPSASIPFSHLYHPPSAWQSEQHFPWPVRWVQTDHSSETARRTKSIQCSGDSEASIIVHIHPSTLLRPPHPSSARYLSVIAKKRRKLVADYCATQATHIDGQTFSQFLHNGDGCDPLHNDKKQYTHTSTDLHHVFSASNRHVHCDSVDSPHSDHNAAPVLFKELHHHCTHSVLLHEEGSFSADKEKLFHHPHGHHQLGFGANSFSQKEDMSLECAQHLQAAFQGTTDLQHHPKQLHSPSVPVDAVELNKRLEAVVNERMINDAVTKLKKCKVTVTKLKDCKDAVTRLRNCRVENTGKKSAPGCSVLTCKNNNVEQEPGFRGLACSPVLKTKPKEKTVHIPFGLLSQQNKSVHSLKSRTQLPSKVVNAIDLFNSGCKPCKRVPPVILKRKAGSKDNKFRVLVDHNLSDFWGHRNNSHENNLNKGRKKLQKSKQKLCMHSTLNADKLTTQKSSSSAGEERMTSKELPNTGKIGIFAPEKHSDIQALKSFLDLRLWQNNGLSVSAVQQVVMMLTNTTTCDAHLTNELSLALATVSGDDCEAEMSDSLSNVPGTDNAVKDSGLCESETNTVLKQIDKVLSDICTDSYSHHDVPERSEELNQQECVTMPGTVVGNVGDARATETLAMPVDEDKTAVLSNATKTEEGLPLKSSKRKGAQRLSVIDARIPDGEADLIRENKTLCETSCSIGNVAKPTCGMFQLHQESPSPKPILHKSQEKALQGFQSSCPHILKSCSVLLTDLKTTGLQLNSQNSCLIKSVKNKSILANSLCSAQSCAKNKTSKCSNLKLGGTKFECQAVSFDERKEKRNLSELKEKDTVVKGVQQISFKAEKNFKESYLERLGGSVSAAGQSKLKQLKSNTAAEKTFQDESSSQANSSQKCKRTLTGSKQKLKGTVISSNLANISQSPSWNAVFQEMTLLSSSSCASKSSAKPPRPCLPKIPKRHKPTHDDPPISTPTNNNPNSNQPMKTVDISSTPSKPTGNAYHLRKTIKNDTLSSKPTKSNTSSFGTGPKLSPQHKATPERSECGRFAPTQNITTSSLSVSLPLCLTQKTFVSPSPSPKPVVTCPGLPPNPCKGYTTSFSPPVLLSQGVVDNMKNEKYVEVESETKLVKQCSKQYDVNYQQTPQSNRSVFEAAGQNTHLSHAVSDDINIPQKSIMSSPILKMEPAEEADKSEILQKTCNFGAYIVFEQGSAETLQQSDLANGSEMHTRCKEKNTGFETLRKTAVAKLQEKPRLSEKDSHGCMGRQAYSDAVLQSAVSSHEMSESLSIQGMAKDEVTQEQMQGNHHLSGTDIQHFATMKDSPQNSPHRSVCFQERCSSVRKTSSQPHRLQTKEHGTEQKDFVYYADDPADIIMSSEGFTVVGGCDLAASASIPSNTFKRQLNVGSKWKERPTLNTERKTSDIPQTTAIKQEARRSNQCTRNQSGKMPSRKVRPHIASNFCSFLANTVVKNHEENRKLDLQLKRRQMKQTALDSELKRRQRKETLKQTSSQQSKGRRRGRGKSQRSILESSDKSHSPGYGWGPRSRSPSVSASSSRGSRSPRKKDEEGNERMYPVRGRNRGQIADDRRSRQYRPYGDRPARDQDHDRCKRGRGWDRWTEREKKPIADFKLAYKELSELLSDKTSPIFEKKLGEDEKKSLLWYEDNCYKEGRFAGYHFRRSRIPSLQECRMLAKIEGQPALKKPLSDESSEEDQEDKTERSRLAEALDQVLGESRSSCQNTGRTHTSQADDQQVHLGNPTLAEIHIKKEVQDLTTPSLAPLEQLAAGTTPVIVNGTVSSKESPFSDTRHVVIDFVEPALDSSKHVALNPRFKDTGKNVTSYTFSEPKVVQDLFSDKGKCSSLSSKMEVSSGRSRFGRGCYRESSPEQTQLTCKNSVQQNSSDSRLTVKGPCTPPGPCPHAPGVLHELESQVSGQNRLHTPEATIKNSETDHPHLNHQVKTEILFYLCNQQPDDPRQKNKRTGDEFDGKLQPTVKESRLMKKTITAKLTNTVEPLVHLPLSESTRNCSTSSPYSACRNSNHSSDVLHPADKTMRTRSENLQALDKHASAGDLVSSQNMEKLVRQLQLLIETQAANTASDPPPEPLDPVPTTASTSASAHCKRSRRRHAISKAPWVLRHWPGRPILITTVERNPDYQPNPLLAKEVEVIRYRPDPRLNLDRPPFVAAGKSQQYQAMLLKEKKHFLSRTKEVKDIPLEPVFLKGKNQQKDPRHHFRSTAAEIDDFDHPEKEDCEGSTTDFSSETDRYLEKEKRGKKEQHSIKN